MKAQLGLSDFALCQAHVLQSPLRQCSAAVPGDSNGEWGRWSELLGNSALVVGLHPDQATGGVVELARAFHKPFAVVPCCTFADDFPNRRLFGGKVVRTYGDIVAWLKEQMCDTEVGYLSFYGKNLVVYKPNARDTANAMDTGQI